MSCSPTPILFVAVCGDGIEVWTRSSNGTSSAFLVAGNITSKSSCVGWHAELLSAVIVGLCKDPIHLPRKCMGSHFLLIQFLPYACEFPCYMWIRCLLSHNLNNEHHQYCPLFKRHVLVTVFFKKQLYWTHKKDDRLLSPSCWMDKEAHHIAN